MRNDKYKELLRNLPSTLKMRLDNIKRYLYFNRGEKQLGSASLLVGSGFSKNADKGIDVSMLDWNELGKKFYTMLYGEEPKDSDLVFSSPIKLATMVNAEFGRTVLDKMIQDSLPDDRVFPNDLYIRLLNLPWHDVFTTNYDRLLERTVNLVGSTRHYHVVTNKETLIYTPSPRIVKLHGSFPDIHPYIITEEDFRTYPAKYPEFVNTVRQSLIENLFCMIGFSGDDPNFLSWIGWLRDVMGRLSMPVYMITFDNNIHGAQLQLYQKQNIQVVNLADVKGISTYREAFEFLFEYLSTPTKDNKEWNCSLSYDFSSGEKIKDTIQKAATIRKSYPGWLILPERYIHFFNESIDSYEIAKNIKSIKDSNVLIDLLFEFDWRLNVSLTPRRLDWFIEELEYITIEDNDDLKKRHKKLWLLISLLNVYRHTGDTEKYDKLKDIIASKLHEAPDALWSRYYNEVSLFYLCQLKYDEALNLIKDWQPVRTDYKSRILRVTIWCECGKEKDAIKELQELNTDIKNQKLSENFTSSPFLDSCLQQAMSLLNIYDFGHYHKAPVEQKTIIGIQSFIKKLKDKKKDHFMRVHGFGINTHSSSWNFGSGDFENDYLNAYRILTWMEESGYPFGHYLVSTEEEAMTLAISNIIEYEPVYAIQAIVRSCNSNVVKNVLTREVINKVDISFMDKTFVNYLPFVWGIGKEYNSSRLYREYFCIRIFSRLAIKASEENVAATFKLMLDNIGKIGLSFDRSDFYVVFNCLTPSSINQVVNALYSIPFKTNRPIDLPTLPDGNYYISDDLIRYLENGMKDEDSKVRIEAYKRIISVFNSLSDLDKEELKTSIYVWRNVKDQNIPMRESYHYFPFNIDEMTDIKAIVNEEIDAIKVGEYRSNGKSSDVISKFNSRISRILPVINYADALHKNSFMHKLTEYLTDNENVFKADDGQELMGGLRSFTNRLLYNIGGIIINSNPSSLDEDIANNLYIVLKRYTEYSFHVLYPLSRLAKAINNVDDLAPIITKNLFTGTITGTVDALSALFQVETVFFDENLMTKIENYVEFANSEDIPAYINYIATLIKDGIYPLDDKSTALENKSKQPLSRNQQLSDMLMNITIKIKNNEDISFITDIEYETIRLVHEIVKRYPDTKDSAAVAKWKEINDNVDTFNDVKL